MRDSLVLSVIEDDRNGTDSCNNDEGVYGIMRLPIVEN